MSIKAMNWALETGKVADLTSSERLVLMVLAHHHHDRTNACFPAVQTVSELAGLSTRRVQMTLRRLEDAGLISIEKRTERGRQRSNQYDLFGRLRGETSVTPQRQSRGDKKNAPQQPRGVKPASPDREYTNTQAAHDDVSTTHLAGAIAFPRSVGES